MFMVSYGENEVDIVEKGIDAIREVLYHGTYEESASLLFCLERYLDPWFGYAEKPENQERIEQISLLLQEAVLDETLNIDKGEALHQLAYCAYSEKPLTLFEKVLELDAESLEENLRKAIEHTVYLPKIYKVCGDGFIDEVLDSNAEAGEYNREFVFNWIIKEIKGEKNSEKIASWGAEWLEYQFNVRYGD